MEPTYRDELVKLHQAQKYIEREFGEEAALDFMINECKNFAKDGEFSKYVEEYSAKTPTPLTEAEIDAALPKNEYGKAIWSHKDV